MLELIKTYPEVVTALVGVLVALLTVVSKVLYSYAKKFVGEEEAKLIVQAAIEQVGKTAEARVRNATEQKDKQNAVGFKEAVGQIKGVVRNKIISAIEPARKAIRDGVDTVDEKKETPKRKSILGFIGRGALWLLKKRIGL
ncbi:MAG: hypothetical protein ACYTFI_00925 [Planctomycetota bacterium]|jgi:hypothetical protein